MQVADRFADEVWLAELAPVQDPAQVATVVAAAPHLALNPESGPHRRLLATAVPAWQCGGMGDQRLDDKVVRLRDWADDDAAWYAQSVRDPMIQRFTTESPALDAGQVLAAIVRLRASGSDAGFVVCDAVTGARLGNIALQHDAQSGEISYWVAAAARGRGVATRALIMFSTWSFHAFGLKELWLLVHRDNIASQRVALRAGYRRDPGRDTSQQVKGAIWPMVGFTMARHDA